MIMIMIQCFFRCLIVVSSGYYHLAGEDGVGGFAFVRSVTCVLSAMGLFVLPSGVIGRL